MNENLTSGPDLLNNLVSVLTRFRTGKIAMMSDIEQMFHQVLVPEKDQNSLRFLWRNQQSNIIEEYKFLIHFQGKTDSPCCCNWALRKCAENQEEKVSEAITKNFYMDDFLGCSKSPEEAIDIAKKLISTLQEGGFRLTKWISNSTEFLSKIPKEELSPKITEVRLDNLPIERALGVFWDPNTDVFKFKIGNKLYKETKRGLLSLISSVFDPLGFLTPCMIEPKLLIQTLWSEKIDWDDELPPDILCRVKKWKEGLDKLDISIPRWIYYVDEVFRVELHIFCDASFKAYGAVSFLRIVKRN